MKRPGKPDTGNPFVQNLARHASRVDARGSRNAWLYLFFAHLGHVHRLRRYHLVRRGRAHRFELGGFDCDDAARDRQGDDDAEDNPTEAFQKGQFSKQLLPWIRLYSLKLEEFNEISSA
jgi:hypothetical protein